MDALTPVAGRRICLIGGAGFIGHHLAIELKASGADVTIVDGLQVNNLLAREHRTSDEPWRGHASGILEERLEAIRAAGVPLHVHDARELGGLRRTLERIQPQTVVHLAGLSNAARSNREPQEAYEHLSTTLQHALVASRDIAEHFVFFSSSMVYGHFGGGTVTEDTPCNPLGIYGALKYGGEYLVKAHGQVTGMPWTIIRPSALYGPRCVSRRVLQIFIEALERDLPLTIDGTGEERLDFTYVDDLVEGTIRVIEQPAAHDEIFNITYGRGRSIREAIDVLRRHHPGVQVVHRKKDRLVPDRGTLSVDKARRLLGFRPRWSIEWGLERYLAWYHQRRALAPEPAAVLREWLQAAGANVPARSDAPGPAAAQTTEPKGTIGPSTAVPRKSA